MSFGSLVRFWQDFASLRYLDLTGNGLDSLPDVSVFSGLEILSLERNRLHSKDVLIALSFLDNLFELNLNENELRGIPVEAAGPGCFPVLQTLGLAKNRIDDSDELLPLTQLPVLQEV